MVHRATADGLSSNPSLVKQLLVVAAVATLAAGEQGTRSGDRAYPIPTQQQQQPSPHPN